MKIVPDTNVLISGIVFGGPCRQIIEGALTAKFTLAVSHDILKELTGVLVGRKFRFSANAALRIERELCEIAELTVVTHRVKRIKNDPDDDRILECALSAKARIIVSGDSDLLSVRSFRGIRILTPKAFLDEMGPWHPKG